MTLVSFLGQNYLADSFWDDFFDPNKQGFDAKQILQEIGSNLGNNFYPTADKVLDIFTKDFSNAKYIIMAQDPYATYFKKDCYATGRALEMAFVNTWQDLINNQWGDTLKDVMRTIFRCSLQDLPTYLNKMNITPTEWFDKSEREGVIWINSSLTVLPAYCASRGERQQYKEWEKIMSHIVEYIINNAPNLKKAFALGTHAYIVLEAGKYLYRQNNKKNIPIQLVDHPTNDSNPTGFYNSNIFSQMKNDIDSFDSAKLI